MQNDTRTEKEIHQVFDFTLLLKGIHALIEIIGGFVFLFYYQSHYRQFC